MSGQISDTRPKLGHAGTSARVDLDGYVWCGACCRFRAAVMPHPHDALFKSAFEAPGSAAALVRSLVPAAIRDAICWDTITGERGSFVDAVLAEHHGDLVFSALLRGQHAGRLFLLLEHQSTQDTAMTLRTLTYQTRIWNLVRKGSSTTWLPPVLSVVISHAPGGWTSARAFAGMFDPWVLASPEMAALVPQFSLIVDDLTEHSNAALQARSLAAYPRLVLWLLRDGRDPVRLLHSFDAWRDSMLEVERSPDARRHSKRCCSTCSVSSIRGTKVCCVPSCASSARASKELS
jgi:hypothetical protein